MGRSRGLLVIAAVSGVLAACRALIGLDDVSLRSPAGPDDANADVEPGGGPIRRLGQVCSRDGFCWVNPLPQGNALRGVWGASENDVWAVGDFGTIMHFDGARWSGLARDPRDQYTAIASDGKGRIWIGGSRDGRPLLLLGTNASFDSDFQPVVIDDGPDARTATQALSLWFDGVDTLYVGRDDGAVLKLVGTATATKATAATKPIAGLWGERGNDLWAVGAGNTVLRYHYVDDTWRAVPIAGGADWTSVVGANDVVYLAGGGTIVEISGGGPIGASFTASPASDLALGGVMISGDGTPMVVGTENKGSCVYERDPTTQKWTRSYSASLGLDVGDGLIGASPTGKEAWAVGLGGAIARWVGAKWTPAFERNKLDPTQPDEAVRAMLPASDTELWVVGEKTLSRFGGAKPSQMTAPGPITSAALVGNAIWTTTADGVNVHLDDGGWSTPEKGKVSEPTLVVGRNALDALAIGTMSVTTSSSGGFPPPPPQTSSYVAASRYTDAGWSDAIQLLSASSWYARGAWAGDDGNYYIVFARCEVTPCAARDVSIATIDPTNKVGDRTDDVSDRDGGPTVTGELIAVWGMNGEHYFGGAFDPNSKVDAGNLVVRGATSATRFELPKGPVDAAAPPVTVLHGAGGDLWAAGDVGTVWHRSGDSWAVLASGYFGAPITAIFVRVPGDVWIAANTGAILHRVP